MVALQINRQSILPF